MADLEKMKVMRSWQGLWLMIYEIEVSEQADSDLRGIFEYIAFLRVMYAGRDIDNQLNLHTKQ